MILQRDTNEDIDVNSGEEGNGYDDDDEKDEVELKQLYCRCRDENGVWYLAQLVDGTFKWYHEQALNCDDLIHKLLTEQKPLKDTYKERHQKPSDTKRKVNQMFAGLMRHLMQRTGKEAHCLILDTAQMITAQALVNVGMHGRNIHCPNPGDACLMYSNPLNIRAYPLTCNQYLTILPATPEMEIPAKFNGCFYDGCATFEGTDEVCPRSDLEILFQHRRLTQDAVLAVTVATRSTQQVEFRGQMTADPYYEICRMAGLNGYSIKNSYTKTYKSVSLLVFEFRG